MPIELYCVLSANVVEKIAIDEDAIAITSIQLSVDVQKLKPLSIV